ncbi:MAG: hypothetical protein HYY26_02990 [Acidobacteria bacterium]|nr:hypothetical protein [Acidobacteriota bacterium]
MQAKSVTLLLIEPGAALRQMAEDLKRRYGYELRYAADPYEAVQLLENAAVDAAVCEAVPDYTTECRLLREICWRSIRLPVFLFVTPEGEEYVPEDLAQGTFGVVRPGTPLEEIHGRLEESIARLRRRAA